MLLAVKDKYPDRFYTFLGLDHCGSISRGAVAEVPIAEQAERMIALGTDGIKLIESKPLYRRMADIPVDSDYYEPLFAHAEQAGMVVLLHVADPEEFWDPELCPIWAKNSGWAYDDTFPPKSSSTRR
jgi:predicted TIM-barrel fold metal-dependent hydrolase